MNFIWWLWAPIGWTLGLLWMSLVVLVGLFATIFVPYRTWYPWIRPLMARAFTWSTTVTPTLIYDPDFDPDRRAIFIANHVTALDGLVGCCVLPHAFCGLENEAHFRVPIYGWILMLSQGVRVPKAREGRYEAILEQVALRKERGISILAFPEGHRTVTGQVRPFRTGSFRMAQAIGSPIIPVASRGLYEVMPKGTGLFRHSPVTIRVGPTFETKGLSEEELVVLTQDVHDWIQKNSM